jgi:hypothetical protein
LPGNLADRRSQFLDVAVHLYQFFPKGHEQFIEDTIRYTDDRTIEFMTPANKFGIGTYSKKPSPYQIVGRACVTEPTDSPDFAVLSVAMPKKARVVAKAIVTNWDRCDP